MEEYDNCKYKKYIAEAEDVFDVINRFGAAVVPNIVANECKDISNILWHENTEDSKLTIIEFSENNWNVFQSEFDIQLDEIEIEIGSSYAMNLTEMQNYIEYNVSSQERIECPKGSTIFWDNQSFQFGDWLLLYQSGNIQPPSPPIPPTPTPTPPPLPVEPEVISVIELVTDQGFVFTLPTGMPILPSPL